MKNNIIYIQISKWLWDNIGWQIRNIYRSIQNLIRWFPVICKDRDWDQHFIWEILKTKLKHQSQYIGDRALHTRAKYDSERMMWCVRLINKIQEETYSSEYMDYHKSNYNWLDIEDKPDYKQLEIEEVSNNFNDYFLKHPLEYKRVINNPAKQTWAIEDINDSNRIAMNISYNRERRAKKILFTLLERHIDFWWE
jgi:hypothetical protein